MLLGPIFFVAYTGAGRDARAVRPIGHQIEDLAQLIGLGISQVSLRGHRLTPDGDIFDALALDKHRSMLSFSIIDARARIEALPWIRRANVTRQLPNGLRVEVRERKAYALWRNGDSTHLIDRLGRVLAAIAPDAADRLPLVIGTGAATRAHHVLVLIAQYPRIARRLVAAQRVGDRRWTLWLANGSAGTEGETAVHLPQNNPRRALDVLAKLDRSSRILDRALAAIDLRNKTLLKLTPAASGRGQATGHAHAKVGDDRSRS